MTSQKKKDDYYALLPETVSWLAKLLDIISGMGMPKSAEKLGEHIDEIMLIANQEEN